MYAVIHVILYQAPVDKIFLRKTFWPILGRESPTDHTTNGNTGMFMIHEHQRLNTKNMQYIIIHTTKNYKIKTYVVMIQLEILRRHNVTLIL